MGPNFTLLRKVKRSLPARSSTPTAARRLRASAYCESGKLCLQSHPLVPVSSAREPLCTTGLLKPLEIPTERFEQVSMDFFTSLPETKANHDAVMVIVDKYTKW